MRFEDFPERFRGLLVEMLADRLAFYLPDEVPSGDFFLRESCRFWEGVVEEGAVVEAQPGRRLWHHQVRRSAEEPPRLSATTSIEEQELRFLELGPSRLAEAFHNAVGWLDSGSPEVPEALIEGDVIVRLLSIRRSFFFGLSFHLDEALQGIVPLTYPRYFVEKESLSPRFFLTPAELAGILSEAPSLFGVNG